MTLQLSTTEIRTDGGTQTRAVIDDATVAIYADDMRDGAVFPPITVFFDGNDYWLADGFHRLRAAWQLGRDTIAADVHQGTRRDAVLFSVGANATHGLRRTNFDKRRAVEVLLNDEEWAKWSNSEIARRCGVSHTFVNNVRSLEGVSSENRTYTTKHGTVATMNTAGIGSKPSSIERVLFDEHDWQDEPSIAVSSAPAIQLDDADGMLTPYEAHIAAHYAPPLITQRDQQRHVLTSQKTTVWYTPRWCLDAVRAVLGPIELDPASSAEANETVQATRFYTRADNGLALPWKASTLFLNPPYGKHEDGTTNQTSDWCRKAVSEYEAGNIGAAILLVFSKLGYNWFEDLWSAYPTCFVRRRISFVRPTRSGDDYTLRSDEDEDSDEEKDTSAKHASAFVYLGPNRDQFREVFAVYGRVIYPEEARQ